MAENIRWADAFVALASAQVHSDDAFKFWQARLRKAYTTDGHTQTGPTSRRCFKRFAEMTCMYQANHSIGIPDGDDFFWQPKVTAEEYLADFEAAKRKQLVYDDVEVTV